MGTALFVIASAEADFGAAGIWMTAAIGVSIGLGRLGTAMLGVLLAWIVLTALVRVEERIDGSSNRA